MNNIKYINIISQCPYCNSNLTIINNNGIKILKCENNKCNQKLINKLEHFCSKSHGLDIKGLSKATFEKLIDWGWINNIEDIFNLNQYRNEWIKKSGFGIASVDKILKSIEEHRHTTLDAFISAIGIPLIGKVVAKEITKYYSTWEEFREAVGGEWSLFENFGPEIEKAINNFDYTEADKIANLLIFESPIEQNISNNLQDKKIVITGKLYIYKNREELKKNIVNHGGKVVSTVTKTTSYLINNNPDSSSAKNKTAKLYKIPIISEKEFVEKFF